MSQVKDDSGRYSVAMEVAAPLAIFTRPDTGGAPSSYPVPTWSAAKGILESIETARRGSIRFESRCADPSVLLAAWFFFNTTQQITVAR